MSDRTPAPPTLQYFDCRSRGQALRFALCDAGVHFLDARFPVEDLTAWRGGADDPDRGGPFASLPVLTWDAHVVAQTLAIAAYLAEKLNADWRSATPEARSLQWMVMSAAHLDTQAPYSGLLWASAETEDPLLTRYATGLRDVLIRKFASLERVLQERAAPGGCFAGAEPGIADWFVFESLDRAEAVFGSALEPAWSACPGLTELARRLAARPRIAAARENGDVPYAVTASPSERQLRERLPELL